MISFRVPGKLAERLDGIGNRTGFIRESLEKALEEKEYGIGKVGKVRVIVTTNAKYYKAGDLSGATASVPVFATIVIGADAYGTTKITGGGAELITHDKGEIGGPLNQFSTVGWKQTKAAEILVDDYMVKIYSASSQGSLVTASN